MGRMHPETIIVWPDHTWCYANELSEYTHMSDDYVAVFPDAPIYKTLESLLTEQED